MDLRGQRFTVDFSDDDESAQTLPRPTHSAHTLATAFIGDITERPTKAPTAPRLKTSSTGFPEHKKRVSAFKRQRAGLPEVSTDVSTAQKSAVPPAQPAKAEIEPSFEEAERRRIDEENSQRLAAMSAEEIQEEREELMAGLNPTLIERLLRRANLDIGRGDTGTDPPSFNTGVEEAGVEAAAAADALAEPASLPETKREVLNLAEDTHSTPAPKPAGKQVAAQKSVRFQEDEEPAEPIDLQAASAPYVSSADLQQPSIHFPTPPAAPTLDPSDPSFLENLHQKYFPSLPADPSKLAWMAPIPTHGSIADQESPYYPAHEALPASALRFDFRGGILPPRIARAMPVSKGLHHHGEAPEAAGYTVPEMARLARSAFPAQRCIAYQTLGRLLYRLGRGEWGNEGTDISKGLWRCIEEGKVIKTLEEAASVDGGHQGSKAYAVEALWLWQKGGGRVWKAD